MDKKAAIKQKILKPNNMSAENKNTSLKNKVICPRNAIPKTTVSTPTPATTTIGVDAPDVALTTREGWGGDFEFLLSLLGYSVGLGNVWRFPYLCYNNGGGAFLIPFTVMLIIAGLPLMFMELSFGQYAGLGPVAIYFRFCPLANGFGIGMVLVSFVVMLYYNMIMSWTIHYLFASMKPKLPWKNCEPEWSTKYCYSYEKAGICESNNGTFYQQICYNYSDVEALNLSALAANMTKRPPAEDYFNNHVLRISKGIEDTGDMSIPLAICLFIAWAIVFLCLCRGVQSSGKVVYFTALFPYVVLLILFIRGITLPGALNGIRYYLTPDFRQLANAQVWGDAAVQIFFALSPSWGGLITLSSYNKFNNNCYKDALIVAVCNILTSFFAGLVIFAIIGFLAHSLHVPIEKVVDQGAGLAFIVYAEVVAKLPGAKVWAVLFFFMLLTLGLDSQFALMETVTTAILDNFPILRAFKTWVVLLVSILGYLGGLIFTFQSGMYWLQLMDKYAANWSVLLIAIFECVLIAWIYGAQRFLNDIQSMIGKRSYFWNLFWSTMWRFITPAALLFILFFNWVEYKPASYGIYVYPLWANTVGWIIGLLPVAVIIAIAIYQCCIVPKHLNFKERMKYLLTPTAAWGPAGGAPCLDYHNGSNIDELVNSKNLLNKTPTAATICEDDEHYLSENQRTNFHVANDIVLKFKHEATDKFQYDIISRKPLQSFSGSINGKQSRAKMATGISPSRLPLISAEQSDNLNNDSKITTSIAHSTKMTSRDSKISTNALETAQTSKLPMMTTFTATEVKLIESTKSAKTTAGTLNSQTLTNLGNAPALHFSSSASILQPTKLSSVTKVTATQLQPLTSRLEKTKTISTTLSSDETTKKPTALQSFSKNLKPATTKTASNTAVTSPATSSGQPLKPLESKF